LKYTEAPGRILPQVVGSTVSTDLVEIKEPESVGKLQGARMPSGLMNKVYTTPTHGARGTVVPIPGQQDIEFPPTQIRETAGNGVIRGRVRVNQHTTQWLA